MGLLVSALSLPQISLLKNQAGLWDGAGLQSGLEEFYFLQQCRAQGSGGSHILLQSHTGLSQPSAFWFLADGTSVYPLSLSLSQLKCLFILPQLSHLIVSLVFSQPLPGT